MGRIRTVKPEFFKHSGLFDLEKETSLPIRVAFAGLWTCCDREGRFKWRPRELKLDVLPYDDCDFSRVLDALVTGGFIVKYEVEREEYACIPSWHTHQIVNNRESASVIPEVAKHKPLRPRVPHASVTPLVGKGKEGERKGKEGEEQKQAQAPSLSGSLPDWLPAQPWAAYVEMRKRIRKAMTQEAARRMQSKLQKWRDEGHDIEEILWRSVENSWQGLWPPGGQNGNQKRNPGNGGDAGGEDGPDLYAALYGKAEQGKPV